MLETVFSFRGRINRLQYFASVVALGAALIVPVLVIGLGLLAHGGVGAKPPLATLALMGLFFLLSIPPFLWVSFSLQARRFRDIGWNPLYVIPGWMVFQVFDRVLAQFVPALSIGPLHYQTWIGLLVSLTLGGALLFWPGRAEDDAPPGIGASWLRPSEPTPAAPATTATYTPAPSPAAASTPRFGRRGL
jgi:uncharacterized membrane protein YhaH (DUF805 family)